MLSRKLMFFFKEALGWLRRSGFLGIASVGVMIIALVVLGAFLILQSNLSSLMHSLKEKMEVVVFLKDGVSEDKAKELLVQITSKEGVKKVEWVSKEKAFEEFSKDPEMKGLLQASGGNPLPASFSIQLSDHFNDPAKVDELSSWLLKDNAALVEEVKFGHNEAQKLLNLMRVARLLGFAFAAGLILAAVFMVFSTSRLTIHARREEVEIMRLVGASPHFVRGPFLAEGLLQGLLSGLISVGMLFVLQQLFIFQIKSQLGLALSEIFPAPLGFLTLDLCVKLIGFGVFLGVTGSFLGVRGILKNRE